MRESMETTRPKLGKKDFTILFTGIGTCIFAALGTVGVIPLPGL